MKQRNVKQQNDLTEEGIRALATYWLATGWPTALLLVARERGIDCEQSILVNFAVDFPGMSELWGILLTSTGQFISFEIDTDSAHEVVEGVQRWEDVTTEQNLSHHNRGTGVGRGALALNVLRELISARAP